MAHPLFEVEEAGTAAEMFEGILESVESILLFKIYDEQSLSHLYLKLIEQGFEPKYCFTISRERSPFQTGYEMEILESEHTRIALLSYPSAAQYRVDVVVSDIDVIDFIEETLKDLGNPAHSKYASH